MKQIQECRKCGWVGSLMELVLRSTGSLPIYLCPKCESREIHDCDPVSSTVLNRAQTLIESLRATLFERGSENYILSEKLKMATKPAIAPTRTKEECRFLAWVAERMVNMYGEDERVDFVAKLREMADGKPVGYTVGWNPRKGDKFNLTYNSRPSLKLGNVIHDNISHDEGVVIIRGRSKVIEIIEQFGRNEEEHKFTVVIQYLGDDED